MSRTEEFLNNEKYVVRIVTCYESLNFHICYLIILFFFFLPSYQNQPIVILTLLLGIMKWASESLVFLCDDLMQHKFQFSYIVLVG